MLQMCTVVLCNIVDMQCCCVSCCFVHSRKCVILLCVVLWCVTLYRCIGLFDQMCNTYFFFQKSNICFFKVPS